MLGFAKCFLHNMKQLFADKVYIYTHKCVCIILIQNKLHMFSFINYGYIDNQNIHINV